MFFGPNRNNPIKFEQQRDINTIVNFCFQQMRSVVDQRKGGSEKGQSSKGSDSNQNQDSESDAVIVLTDDNFDDSLKDSKFIWMVKFYGIIDLIFSSVVWSLQKIGP